MRIVDVDANATRPATEAAIRAFAEASSLTRASERRAVLHASRETIAAALHARPEEIVFTRGGSHADAMALWAGVWTSQHTQPRLALSRAEHRASLDAAREIEHAKRAQIAWLPVNAWGCVTAHAIEHARGAHPLSLVSMLGAHNETGVIQPLSAIAAACQRTQTPLHIDAVQMLGRLPLPWSESSISLMSLAGHKVGSLGGIGALLVRADSFLHPLLLGNADAPFAGGFAYADGEAGASAGLCASFAAALSDLDGHLQREASLAPLRDAFETHLNAKLRAEGMAMHVLGGEVPRLPNTSLLRLPGVPADGLLMALDVHGFSASSGSACKAGAPEPSTSLQAMGLADDEANEVIRVSLRWPEGTDAQALPHDLEKLVAAIVEIARHALTTAVPL